MIFIDAREGLSGDMLLAAMIGLLEQKDRDIVLNAISNAAEVVNVGFRVSEVEDFGDVGLGIAYAEAQTEEVNRSYEDALGLLSQMHEQKRVQKDATLDRSILDQLFEAEAMAHDTNVGNVHLHEVGRASAILNMFGLGQAHSLLKKAEAGDFVCSTITTGKGIIVIAHGAVRVPAPACKYLLKGLRHEKGTEQGERATPSGLAALRVLARSQSDDIPVDYRKRSVGFGTRRFGGRLGRVVLLLT